MVSSLQRILIRVVSKVSWVSFNDALYLINFAGQSSGRDQLRQLPVDETRAYSELISHRFNPHCFVGLQKLSVDDHPGLSGEVLGVSSQVRISFHPLDNF